MRHVVILAGGAGTRLWPASRRARPKQLLPIGANGETLLAAAIRRGRALAADRVVVVTADAQLEATRVAVPGVELIGEPVGRNTAAAIGLAAAILARRDPEAVLAILPADQHVANEPGMVHALGIAYGAVEAEDTIATIGIPPTRPETGFGYLEVASATLGEVTPVLRFVEKPDRATAEAYAAGGRHLWNAGMFVASARRLLAELATHLPATADAVEAIAGEPARAAELYRTLTSISIDHAVMERTTRVVTVPAQVGWDDVGSWAALPALLGADPHDNTISGPAIVEGTGNIVVSDDDTLIAAFGVFDLVIVKSGGAILVIPRSEAQRVREVADAVAERGLVDLL